MKHPTARRLAFDVLLRVHCEAAFADELLHARRGSEMPGRDAGLATELTYGVLRWQRLLDWLIARQVDRGLESLDAEVLITLRLGLYQLRFLDRVPAHAAVSQSVELVRVARKKSAVPFVNAVLRKLAKTGRQPAAPLLPADASPAERLGIEFSHPTWLVERWLARFGQERTRGLLAANNQAPRLTLAIQDPALMAQIEAELRATGASSEPGLWLAGAIRVRGVSPMQTEAMQRGSVSVQDEASQMVALLPDVQAGDFVLDVCAAPGGKTAALAHAAGDSGRVVAGDLHQHRLQAMLVRFAGTPLARRLLLLALDGARELPFARTFPRILVDAPCSGTGTLARNPEIRWRLQPEDIGNLHARQAVLLRNAIAQLAPGGQLVYSTCSLEPEENEDVVREALREAPGIRLVPAASALRGRLRAEREAEFLATQHDEFFRTFPPRHGTDGFFAAVLERS